MPTKKQTRRDAAITFKFQPSQTRLFRKVKRGAGVYIQLKAPQCLEIGGQRSGKGFHPDTNVVTPHGFRKMRDIKIGSIISHPDGGVTRVIGVYPRGDQSFYRIHFRDGDIIECDADHLWPYFTRQRQLNGKRHLEYVLGTTEQIFDRFHSGSRVHYIKTPCTEPLEFCADNFLSLDSYTVGVLIGDGCISNPNEGAKFASNDPEILDYIPEKTNKLKAKFMYSIPGISEELRRIGLLGKRAEAKFIPKNYLWASIESRWKLLQGLMDTDGTCDKLGHISFCTVSPQLAKDFKFLVQSLGGIATLGEPQDKFYRGEDGQRIYGQPAYVIYISFPDDAIVFRLKRKQIRRDQKPPRGFMPKNLWRTIVNIGKIEKKESICIKVDHPNGLFLVENCIVTHNTTGKMMHGIQEYCLRFAKCDILILRRTIPELDTIIQDMKTFIPEEMYDFNQTTRIATFRNGSRVVYAGCIRGGTRIDTLRGLVPIEKVTTRDFVLTRKGYRRVQWSGMTGIKETVKLDNIWLTPDHQVYCNGAFLPAQDILCQRDSGKTVNLLIQKLSYLKASSTADIQNPSVCGIGTTILDGAAKSTLRCMSRFTKAFMAKYRMVLKFITKTKIAATIPQIISFSSNGELTANYINQIFIPLSPNDVSFAEENLARSIQANERHVLSNVEEHPLAENQEDISPPVPVYDLTVDDQHEYFANGILVHNCANNVERDIEKYLGQAYPYIQVSECAQFSPDVWQRLYARNLVNAACEVDEHGNLPVPRIVGDTNPIGAHWEYYRTVFIDQEPWEKEEGSRKAKDGSWWAPAADGYRCIHNPRDYAFNHTTVLDNMAYLRRDPGIIARLKALPKAKMQKFLLGLIDRVEGQYFDTWSEEHHVIDLREDPEGVIWQPWQPVIGGQDWGVGHHNAFYLFTKALVRSPFGGNDYKMKTVCFKEIAPESTGLTSNEFADLINAQAYYPRLPEDHPQYSQISGKRVKVAAIFFSHEKFSRVMEAHSPADEYSKVLRERGLPPVSRGTMDRIGSAGYMYQELKLGNLVILRTCPAIIQAIPSLQRDPDRLDDVLKTSAKADDRYDAFRLGLYGMYKERGIPSEVTVQIEADKITDPFARHFYLKRKAADLVKQTEDFVQKSVPHWQTKL